MQEATSGRKELLFSERTGIWPFRHHVDYYFVGSIVIADEFVFEDSWRTAKQINAGETVKITDSLDLETEFRYEKTQEEKDTISLGLDLSKIAKLTGKLESTISDKISESHDRKTKRRLEIVREFKLPEAPTLPSEIHVASRHFQRAPVYRKLRANILRRCDGCGGDQLLPVVLYQPTRKIATRHLDYLSEGSEKVLLTGIEIL
jgi:hypothetical protein